MIEEIWEIILENDYVNDVKRLRTIERIYTINEIYLPVNYINKLKNNGIIMLAEEIIYIIINSDNYSGEKYNEFKSIVINYKRNQKLNELCE
jgi:hypothetical protein